MIDNEKNNILSLILKPYGLQPERIESAGGTAGRTWRVIAGGKKYFVRCRGVRTSYPERIRFDHGLRCHLAKHGFCVVPPIEYGDRQSWVEHEKRIYEVYPWVEGKPLTSDLMDCVRIPVAKTLARFHELSSSYSAPCEDLVPQYAHPHFAGTVSQSAVHDDPTIMLEAIEYIIGHYATRTNRGDMLRARARVKRLEDVYGNVQKEFPRQVIHGDYNCFNLLFAPTGEVVGLFDFDWAWRGPRIRDLAEALLCFTGRQETGFDPGSIWSLTSCPQFNLQSMVEIVLAYHSVLSLREEEICFLPLAMLARWTACRTEGIMKVPAERRGEFFLMDFQKPFEWAENEIDNFRILLTKKIMGIGNGSWH